MTRISDMTRLGSLPVSGALVPLAKPGDLTPYNYDLAADLAARPKTTDLAVYAKSADLSNNADGTKGAGLAAFNSALSYTVGSVGAFLKSLLSTIGSSLVGYQASGTGTVARTVASKLDDSRHWKDFGIQADGTTDDTAAVQTAFNWCGPGKILIMPAAKIKITSTVTYGNGSATALSTIGNNCTIIWGGESSNLNALTDTSDPWYSTAQSGTQFVWAGSTGGTMMQWLGPIQGVRMIGAVTLNGGCVSNGGSGAASCLQAYSFSNCTIDSIVAVNWQAAGQGILFTCVSSSGIGTIGSNSVLSGGNIIGRINASSPYGSNGECIRLDGYRAVSGGDFTISRIGTIECGICGTGAKGLVLGFIDDVLIEKVVNTCYGTISGSPWGIYLDTVSTPFNAPARVRIFSAAAGQGLSVGGSTAAQVIIYEYEEDDAATTPVVTGLFIRHFNKTGSAIDQMAFPYDGKFKTRAVADGEGYYAADASGTPEFSMTRHGNAAHVAASSNVEFEAGATGGPTTAAHFNVTTTGTGYPTGVGGAVTQATSKSTAVTLSKVCGAITLNNAALPANTIVSFTLTNTTIAADDDVRVWVKSGNASVGTYRVAAEGNAAGSRTIVVENKTAGSLSEAIVLGFNVLKVAVS